MACTCLCKCAIGFVNALFLLVGILVMALGGVLLAITNNAGMASIIEDAIKKIVESIGAVSPDGANALQNIDFVSLFQPAAIGIFFAGLVIFGIAIIGYCGLSCYDIILKVYLVIIIVLLVVQIIIVAVTFSGGFDGQIRDQITNIIDNEYGGIDDPSIFSVLPNIIMIQFKCCGLDGYGDFNSSKRWNATREIIINDQKQKEVRTLVTPVACCKTNGTFPDVKIVDYNCAVAPTDNISNWHTGCWGEVGKELDNYRTYAILGVSAVLVIQGLIIVFVLIVICAGDD